LGKIKGRIKGPIRGVVEREWATYFLMEPSSIEGEVEVAVATA
jgi:hypothetical protein